VLQMYARLVTRLGLGLLIISLVIRPAIASPANKVGDDLALIASGLLVVVGAAVVRVAGNKG